MQKNIYIIGMGMGNINTLTVEAQSAVQGADLMIGARRVVDGVKTLLKQNSCIVNEYLPKKITETILDNPDKDNIVVAFSGDTGFFSGAKKLQIELSKLDGYNVKTLAGMSSMAYFSSRINESWDDMEIVSLHGKDDNFIHTIKSNEKTFMLTGGNWNVNKILSHITKYDMGEALIFVGERLSYDDERITKGIAKELLSVDFDPLSVMVVLNKNAQKLVSSGIDDSEFIRGEVPMTKSEVRCVSLSKLKIEKTDVLYDIGAGTGSVAVEMALLASAGKVYAIERHEKAVALIEENKRKFKVDNMEVVTGLAPEALLELEKPDAVFIGGSAGNLNEIIDVVLSKNPEARICVNAIALETLSQSVDILKSDRFEDLDVTQLSTAKGKSVGNYTMMTGLNPIFIITAKGKSQD